MTIITSIHDSHQRQKREILRSNLIKRGKWFLESVFFKRGVYKKSKCISGFLPVDQNGLVFPLRRASCSATGFEVIKGGDANAGQSHLHPLPQKQN
jgi:hypothetical protein